MTEDRAPNWIMWASRPWFTRLVQVIAIASLLLSVGVGVRQYAFTSCLGQYADRSAVATQARAEAAAVDRAADAADRHALDRLVVEFEPGNIEAQRNAQQAYRDIRVKTDEKRAEAARLRADHPVPNPPTLRC